MMPPPHIAQDKNPMGLPFNLYFAVLAIGQFGTLTLVAVNYWEHQNLRAQIDSIARVSIDHREPGLKFARKPEYPEDPGPGGAIRVDPEPSAKPEIGLGRGIDSATITGSLGWQSWAALLAILLLLLVFGYWCGREKTQHLGLASVGSPVSKQQLAHRQLAELRLRRHGFSQ